ncbi:PAS domain S-box protein [Azohydromonas aeria]|uniref:PAS domain S-box protein n=1 Tax=Azohydromonas aeria TaxID=2590212 RepID=UPI001E4BD93E|nr:PAS domain S-box protein [Azohydromonas aeria]
MNLGTPGTQPGTPAASPPDDHAVFRSMFTASPDALLLVDGAGTIVLSNPEASRLLGYAADELAGLSVEALVPDAVRHRHAGYRSGYARHPRPRPMGLQMALVARRRDGSEVPVEIALSPLQSQGLPYVLAAIRDVGAYPRVRQALQRARYSEAVAQLGRLALDAREPRQLFERVPAVAAQALECEAVTVLQAQAGGCRRWSSGTAGTAAPGREEAERSVAPDAEARYALAAAEPLSVEDYAQERRFEVPPARLDAGLRSALAVPLLDRGRSIGLLSAHSSRRGRFGEDELRFLQSLSNLMASCLLRAQSEETLLHAQRLESVGQLTGGIAHDFNNLLTVAYGNLQVLQDLPAVAADAYALQLLGAALRACRRGAELTAKLLAFSRRQVLQPREVDVAQLLASLSDMLRRTLDQRIEIEVDAPRCPAVVADPVQLESALLNIAINARDAMPTGGRLRFECRRCTALPPQAARGADAADGTTAYVAIAVSDTGTGMPEAVRERAFEPFFTTKPSGRGTGLGLSTVYGFVIQSRGAITLDSAPGRGTTVTLFIPEVPAANPPAAGSAAPAQPTVPAGLHVLLVEDDTEVRKVMGLFLESMGCRVTACGSAEQALALEAPDIGFDLLLTDIALGAGMRGTELAARAAQRWPGLPVLLMSGYSTELIDGQAQRPWPLLRKPCSREQLAQAVSSVVRRD